MTGTRQHLLISNSNVPPFFPAVVFFTLIQGLCLIIHYFLYSANTSTIKQRFQLCCTTDTFLAQWYFLAQWNKAKCPGYKINKAKCPGYSELGNEQFSKVRKGKYIKQFTGFFLVNTIFGPRSIAVWLLYYLLSTILLSTDPLQKCWQHELNAKQPRKFKTFLVLHSCVQHNYLIQLLSQIVT